MKKPKPKKPCKRTPYKIELWAVYWWVDNAYHAFDSEVRAEKFIEARGLDIPDSFGHTQLPFKVRGTSYG